MIPKNHPNIVNPKYRPFEVRILKTKWQIMYLDVHFLLSTHVYFLSVTGSRPIFEAQNIRFTKQKHTQTKNTRDTMGTKIKCLIKYH